MLENIYLENFKAFKLLDNLDIKPITILCGTNSSGKSTILQSILLAKQTTESTQSGQTLLLNGKFTHLGMFENIVFEKKPTNEVVLGFSCFWKRDAFVFLPSSRIVLPIRFILEQIFPERYLKIKDAKFIIHYRFTLKLGARRSPRTHLKQVLVTNVDLRSEIQLADGNIIDSPQFNFKHIEKDEYSVTWSNIRSKDRKSGQAIGNVNFDNLVPIRITVAGAGRRRKSIEASMDLWMFSEFLQQSLSTFRYIGPLREEPSRRYIYEDEVTEIGLKGENAAYICLTDYDNKIKDCHLFNQGIDSFYKSPEPIKLGEALTHWLETMSIKGFIPKPSNEIVYLNLKSAASTNTLVNIADVGFGVSQVLPILLEGLRMPVGNTLILEQPEIHLHPKLQMQMADYFISLALSNKRVIVETHSDHIVNRLVRRIVEDTRYNFNDLISIYFITPTQDGSKCEKVNIDPERGIVNWPEEFFDQTASELQKTIQAGLNKRMPK